MMKRNILFLAAAGLAVTIWSSGCSQKTTSMIGLTPDLQEIAALAQNHTSDENIIGYIRNSGKTYKLTANDMVLLGKIGVSQNVIAVLMQPPTPVAAPPAVAPVPVAPAAPVATAAPAPVVINVNNPPVPPVPSAVPVAAGAPSAPSAPAALLDEPEPPASPAYFKTQLMPYGEWAYLPEFGTECWIPTGLPAGWRPYFDSGHWVYTDSGMCWESDYPWGAIPFHYGRWIHRANWVWVPAYEYAPAWVLWRHTDSHMGWAPVPPGALFVAGGWEFHGRHVAVDFDFGLAPTMFVFVGGTHFLEHDFHRYELHGEEWRGVYARSELNHFVRDEHSHGFRIEGLERERVEHLVGHRVEPVRHEEIRLHALENLHHNSTPQPRSEPSHPVRPAASGGPAGLHPHGEAPAEAHSHDSSLKKTGPEHPAEPREFPAAKHSEPAANTSEHEERAGHAGGKPAAADNPAAPDTTGKPAAADARPKHGEAGSRGSAHEETPGRTGGRSAGGENSSPPDNSGKAAPTDPKQKWGRGDLVPANQN